MIIVCKQRWHLFSAGVPFCFVFIHQAIRVFLITRSSTVVAAAWTIPDEEEATMAARDPVWLIKPVLTRTGGATSRPPPPQSSRRTYRVNLIATPENESVRSTLSSIRKEVRLTRCRNPPRNRFLVGRSSPFTRLAEHRTALRAWCKQCLPGR